ncbi:MAG: hypothetical protein JO081_15455, partial [Alphaproteobacteria bacterium]|nr:hypothetical protein [Alphaproteobacteria bacterium]
MSDDSALSLAGPAAVSVSVRLSLSGGAKKKPLAIALKNIGAEAVAIEQVGCDPIQAAQSGAVAEGAVSIASRAGDAGARQ